MSKEVIVPGPAGIPLSNVIRCGSLVFLSGQVPNKEDWGKDIRTQTRSTLNRIKEFLEEAGGQLVDVVKTTVFLRRQEDFSLMNEVYVEFFPHDPPARSAVVADLVVPVDIEIEAIAYLK